LSAVRQQIPKPTVPFTNGFLSDLANEQEPPTKKKKFESPEYPDIPSNSRIVSVSSQLKPILRDLLEKCNVVKLWISLLIPKIEDGNNFGVSIQTEVVKEICYAEEDAVKFLEDITENFAQRAKLASKVLRFPQVEDYRTAIMEMDERHYNYLTKYVTQQTLNSYALMFDLITKNYEKIKKPRNTNTSSMY
jgi:proteasome activator subunit 3 (PA28 gamma)